MTYLLLDIGFWAWVTLVVFFLLFLFGSGQK